ncbi:hypothetical protein [Neptuniibacter halophilus]|uniref:hypothetical protein n=1 Tax=Neptuniibacter halophilus TaxID=651666 RepID=UPI0025723003|nr:hypothetical protein [Neptuniibacter halophilus]
MAEEYYTLQMLREELPAKMEVKGVMRAYEKLAVEFDRSVTDVRRWFAAPDTKFHGIPPMDRDIWDRLESLSGFKLNRENYYPKPDFWDRAHG